MTHIRPIKTEADYDRALERISSLMELDDHEAATADELDVLATLVDAYEQDHYPIPLPDPVDAILFRMEQQNITRADLKPYIGSSAKVSEVLSRKRPLTLKMIRALNAHLGIPADVLIGDPAASLPDDLKDVQWDRFPITQMAKWNWIEDGPDLKDRAEESIREMIWKAGGENTSSMVFYRKNNSVRCNAQMNTNALQAWCLYVLGQARSRGLEGKYVDGTIDESFLREVARLSTNDNGPRIAGDFLARHGVAFVYAQHLPRTYLDGAAMRTIEGVPVVGVTVRHDRIDNFWFCLLHELAHLGWHLQDKTDYFIDDLSLDKTGHSEEWKKEDEADKLAQNALIPEDIWADVDINQKIQAERVISLAQEAEVHPAIVAGRIRKETGNYRLLSRFVHNNKIRKQLNEM